MEPRNKEIFNQAQNLTDVFVRFMNSHSFIESYGTLFDRVEALVYADPELIAKILELRQDMKEEELSKCFTQTQRLLKTLMKSDICKTAPHPSTEEGYKNEISWFLTKILEVRKNQNNFFSNTGIEKQYRETLFPRIYKLYEDYLYNPSPKDYYAFPISNLTSSKSIDLETWQIRQLSENEISSLVEVHHKQGIPIEIYPEFIVCLNYDDNWRENVRKIVAVLRLLKREKIFLKHAYRAFAFPFYTWQIFNAPEGTSIAKKVSYEASDIALEEEELKSFWGILSNVSETNYLGTALRRFNFAYEREKIEDAWVDYFISLESLFLKKSGENFELSHRLSNRISKVLGGDTFPKRIEMRKKIRDWYDIRSKIVHGATLKPNELTQIDELNQKVSASIKWFIKNIGSEDHDTILDMLDLM
jgi:hypothetical protein